MSIRLQDISLTLGSRELFDDFQLEVPAGAHVVIQGPSGRGKTSLLNLIMGFVRPDAGKVMVAGRELTDSNVWEMRQQMVMVSQDQQLGQGIVCDIIRDIFQYKANRHLQYSEDKVLKWFEAFSVDRAKLHAPTHSLSGGESQRIALITGLLLERPIMLLDEVTNAIDKKLRSEVISTIASLHNKTIVAVAHENDWERHGFTIINI
jgi:putative ABC transport system ATP-binding protein